MVWFNSCCDTKWYKYYIVNIMVTLRDSSNRICDNDKLYMHK